ncbi:uncharacterized protein TRIADDRAFT_61241 [Trichoplax adhaerens]|uniref:Uncharacterized protein n=1 Tax=Trichoplax adhaerens TaxID=10228 RepID=B3SAF5_TRIAD|nr:predicted protein [Trichoplax adhaerens]EDV20304.1 predicted protein [Trichoplax adhaerens]|eukprot:XP_002117254.1 predicted protein [Trichoplax adhaerens]
MAMTQKKEAIEIKPSNDVAPVSRDNDEQNSNKNEIHLPCLTASSRENNVDKECDKNYAKDNDQTNTSDPYHNKHSASTYKLINCPLERKQINNIVFIFQRIYAMVICILLWFNAVRLWPSLSNYTNTSSMTLMVMCGLWNLHIAGNASFYFYMCHHKMVKFFKQISCKHVNEHSGFLDSVGRYARRRCIIYLIPATIFASLNIAFPIFVHLSSFNDLKSVMSIIASPWENSTIFLYFYISSIHFYCTAAWIYPTVLFCLCCLIMAEKFRNLTRCFRTAVQMGNSSINRAIITYRQQHEDYCTTTELLSDTFSLFVAHLYLTNLAHACFNTYRLIFNWNDNGFWMNMVLTMWLAITTGNTIIVSGAASILNTEAHSSNSILYSLQVANVNNDGLAEEEFSPVEGGIYSGLIQLN